MVNKNMKLLVYRGGDRWHIHLESNVSVLRSEVGRSLGFSLSLILLASS